MINKIKDKQTGEYHDIGGLKCKLVAEGILQYDEDVSSYKRVYDFEEGKYYGILLSIEGYVPLRFLGIQCRDEFISSLTYDSNFDSYYCCFQTNESLLLLNEIKSTDDFHNGFTYKIYELPFTLGV